MKKVKDRLHIFRDQNLNQIHEENLDRPQVLITHPFQSPTYATRHRQVNRLGNENIAFLRTWLHSNGQQRIDIDVKIRLAQMTNLTVDQINNWFKKERRKNRLNNEDDSNVCH